MRIKPRKIRISDISQKESEKEDHKPSFPDIVAKPKEPLPEPNFTKMYAGEDSAHLRRLGNVALDMRSETKAGAPDDGFNAGDYVELLRTPYDASDNMQRKYRNRIKNRSTAIVAMCVDCAGSRKKATECANITCPLWAFRMQNNPFRGR